MCVCIGLHTCQARCTCCHRMICRSRCSFSVTWVPGIKLRLPSLVASALTHRVLLPTLLLNFEDTYLTIHHILTVSKKLSHVSQIENSCGVFTQSLCTQQVFVPTGYLWIPLTMDQKHLEKCCMRGPGEMEAQLRVDAALQRSWVWFSARQLCGLATIASNSTSRGSDVHKSIYTSKSNGICSEWLHRYFSHHYFIHSTVWQLFWPPPAWVQELGPI